MNEKPYGVYVKVDDSNRIVAVDSDAFIADLAEWIKIDEGYGDKYHHAQGNYFEKQVMTIDGVCYYKMVDGEAVECTAEEIKEQEEANKPIPVETTDDVLNALLGVTE